MPPGTYAQEDTGSEGTSTSSQDKRPLRYRLVDLLALYWPEGVLGLAAVAGFLAQIVPRDDVTGEPSICDVPLWVIFAVAYVILGVVGGLFSVILRHNRAAEATANAQSIVTLRARIRDLEREAVEQQQMFRGTVDSLLDGLLRELVLYNSDTRVSAYVHNGAGFVMFSRRSSNPTLASSGRSVYQDNVGVLGKTWREHSAACTDLEENRDDWNKQMVDDWGFTLEEAKAMTMQSRSIAAQRVVDAKNRPFAIVLLESTNPSRVGRNTPSRVMSSETWTAIHELLVSSTEMLPDLVSARAEGF